MARGRGFIRASGGVERTRVFTRIWLALFGLWPWGELPVLPPELIFLPPFVPLNIYDFACWARQTVVALTVVGAHRPTHELGFDIDELRGPGRPRRRAAPLNTWAGPLPGARPCSCTSTSAGRSSSLRQAALRRAERWILQRQEADGSWGGIQPPWVYSLIALRLQGYALDHPVMRAGIEGLDGFTIEDERGRRIEACQSPVWDTALAVTALADAGTRPSDPVLRSAARYLLGEEITVPGDWSVRRPELAPGGLGLRVRQRQLPRHRRHRRGRARPRPDRRADAAGAVDRAVAWIEGMQCRDGGWAAFDVDNTQTLCRELPFCDFGELIDPPSADVTAHVVEMLAALGRASHGGSAPRRGVAAASPGGRRVLVRALGRQLRLRHRSRRPGPRRRRAGDRPPGRPPGRRLAREPSERRRRLGRGPALLPRRRPTRAAEPRRPRRPPGRCSALLAAGERSAATERGVAYLVETQDEDGTWDEP